MSVQVALQKIGDCIGPIVMSNFIEATRNKQAIRAKKAIKVFGTRGRCQYISFIHNIKQTHWCLCLIIGWSQLYTERNAEASKCKPRMLIFNDKPDLAYHKLLHHDMQKTLKSMPVLFKRDAVDAMDYSEFSFSTQDDGWSCGWRAALAQHLVTSVLLVDLLNGLYDDDIASLQSQVHINYAMQTVLDFKEDCNTIRGKFVAAQKQHYEESEDDDFKRSEIATNIKIEDNTSDDIDEFMSRSSDSDNQVDGADHFVDIDSAFMNQIRQEHCYLKVPESLKVKAATVDAIKRIAYPKEPQRTSNHIHANDIVSLTSFASPEAVIKQYNMHSMGDGLYYSCWELCKHMVGTELDNNHNWFSAMVTNQHLRGKGTELIKLLLAVLKESILRNLMGVKDVVQTIHNKGLVFEWSSMEYVTHDPSAVWCFTKFEGDTGHRHQCGKFGCAQDEYSAAWQSMLIAVIENKMSSLHNGKCCILDPAMMGSLKYFACAPCAKTKNHFRNCLLCRIESSINIPGMKTSQKRRGRDRFKSTKISHSSCISERRLLKHLLQRHGCNLKAAKSTVELPNVDRHNFGLYAQSAILDLRRLIVKKFTVEDAQEITLDMIRESLPYDSSAFTYKRGDAGFPPLLGYDGKKEIPQSVRTMCINGLVQEDEQSFNDAHQELYGHIDEAPLRGLMKLARLVRNGKADGYFKMFTDDSHIAAQLTNERRMLKIGEECKSANQFNIARAILLQHQVYPKQIETIIAKLAQTLQMHISIPLFSESAHLLDPAMRRLADDGNMQKEEKMQEERCAESDKGDAKSVELSEPAQFDDTQWKLSCTMELYQFLRTSTPKDLWLQIAGSLSEVRNRNPKITNFRVQRIMVQNTQCRVNKDYTTGRLLEMWGDQPDRGYIQTMRNLQSPSHCFDAPIGPKRERSVYTIGIDCESQAFVLGIAQLDGRQKTPAHAAIMMDYHDHTVWLLYIDKRLRKANAGLYNMICAMAVLEMCNAQTQMVVNICNCALYSCFTKQLIRVNTHCYAETVKVLDSFLFRSRHEQALRVMDDKWCTTMWQTSLQQMLPFEAEVQRKLGLRGIYNAKEMGAMWAINMFGSHTFADMITMRTIFAVLRNPSVATLRGSEIVPGLRHLMQPWAKRLSIANRLCAKGKTDFYRLSRMDDWSATSAQFKLQIDEHMQRWNKYIVGAQITLQQQCGVAFPVLVKIINDNGTRHSTNAYQLQQKLGTKMRTRWSFAPSTLTKHTMRPRQFRSHCIGSKNDYHCDGRLSNISLDLQCALMGMKLSDVAIWSLVHQPCWFVSALLLILHFEESKRYQSLHCLLREISGEVIGGREQLWRIILYTAPLYLLRANTVLMDMTTDDIVVFARLLFAMLLQLLAEFERNAPWEHLQLCNVIDAKMEIAKMKDGPALLAALDARSLMMNGATSNTAEETTTVATSTTITTTTTMTTVTNFNIDQQIHKSSTAQCHNAKRKVQRTQQLLRTLQKLTGMHPEESNRTTLNIKVQSITQKLNAWRRNQSEDSMKHCLRNAVKEMRRCKSITGCQASEMINRTVEVQCHHLIIIQHEVSFDALKKKSAHLKGYPDLRRLGCTGITNEFDVSSSCSTWLTCDALRIAVILLNNRQYVINAMSTRPLDEQTIAHCSTAVRRFDLQLLRLVNQTLCVCRDFVALRNLMSFANIWKKTVSIFLFYEMWRLKIE